MSASTDNQKPLFEVIYDSRNEESLDYSRSECEFMTRNLGKFEREPIYVPFMWNRTLMWGDYPDSDESDSEFRNYCDVMGLDIDRIDYDDFDSEFLASFDRYVYKVNMLDRLIFPELEHVDRVVMWEDSQGFVNSESRELSPTEDTIFVGL